jgi:hypothetical protein
MNSKGHSENVSQNPKSAHWGLSCGKAKKPRGHAPGSRDLILEGSGLQTPLARDLFLEELNTQVHLENSELLLIQSEAHHPSSS